MDHKYGSAVTSIEPDAESQSPENVPGQAASGGGEESLSKSDTKPVSQPQGILVINETGKIAREFRISGDAVHIGRDPQMDVVLGDPGVSRTHARILRQGEGFLLEDLGGRNGTRVNSQRLPQRGTYILQHDDYIQIGRSVLRFLVRMSHQLLQRVRSEAAATGSVSFAEVRDESSRRKDSLCLFRLHKLEASLIVTEAELAAQCHPLESDRVLIGRDPESDIKLNDPTVSANHAEIVYNRDGFHLVDRDSTLGTFLDGVQIRVAKLTHRSFVKFGKQEGLFVIHEEGKEPRVDSFPLRNYLIELFEFKEGEIRKTFQLSRECGLDFAEQLILGGVLTPAEWWASVSEFERRFPMSRSSWIRRLLSRLKA